MSTTVIIVYNMDPQAIAAALAAVASATTGTTIEIRAGGLPSTALAVEEEQLARRLRAHGLTDRECDLVRLDVQGFSRAEIAEQLGISPTTLKKYWSVIYDKLGIQRRSMLRLWIMQAQHTSPDSAPAVRQPIGG
jgi:DNA-binding NarL/FixJ family response regulator